MEKIQNDLFAEVEHYLAESGKTKRDFADDLGVTVGLVTRILNGNFDGKLSTLIKIYIAMGKIPVIHGGENLDRWIDNRC